MEIVFSIRKFVPLLEYDMIVRWWNRHELAPPALGDLPETTYIAELNGVPALCVSLILWNTKSAMVDNFVGNPDLEGKPRTELTRFLLEHLETTARAHGKRRLFCMATTPRLNYYYEQLGFRTTVRSVATLTKEI